jgi:CubicO group peptidase (beta-lactamase class C family)
LKTEFFQPLGMEDTGVHHWADVLPHEATGYSVESGEVKKALDWNMSQAGGAGALYSTVEDLFHWNEGVFGGKLLSEPTLEAAFTPVELKADAAGMPYGYGWVIGEFRGVKEIQHGGGLHGFASHLARYPEHNMTVAVLVNAAPPPEGLLPGSISQELAEFVLWEQMQPRHVLVADSGADPKQFDDFVGRYDYGGAILTVAREGDRLFAQLTGQPKFEIFPRGEDEFFWKVVDAQVTFERNDDKRVVEAVHKQAGQTIHAPRVE